MKIEVIAGCTAYNTLIDDVSLSDKSKDEQIQILDTILAKIKEDVLSGGININSVIDLVQYDKYVNDNEPCEQCGDCITTTTWHI